MFALALDTPKPCCEVVKLFKAFKLARGVGVAEGVGVDERRKDDGIGPEAIRRDGVGVEDLISSSQCY